MLPAASPGPRRGRRGLARSASYPLGAPRWGCPWQIPRASVLGCVRCGGWRLWTQSLTRPVSRNVCLRTGDSAGALELFRVDADTSPCGSEDETPGSRACVRVLVRLCQVGWAGLTGVLWCASPFPLIALSFCFARPPPGWRCHFLGPFFFLSFFSRFFALPCCLWRSLVSGPGCIGPWRLACIFPPPPAGLRFFFFFFFFSFSAFLLRPRCLRLSLVSGPGCPAPRRCVLFVLLAPSPSALRALSPRLCPLLSRWLLSGGCHPPRLPSPFVLPVFPFVCPRCLRLSLVSGPGCRGPLRCVLFVLLSSRLSAVRALSPRLWSGLAVGCPLVVAAPPPPFVTRGFRCCRLVLCFVFFFFSLFFLLPLCAPVVSGSLWFPAPGALALRAVCCLLCWPPLCG